MAKWDAIKEVYGSTELGIAKLDYEGIVLDCNAAFARLVGRDTIACIGLSVVEDLTQKGDVEDSRERFRTLKSGEHISTQKRLRKPSGESQLCQVIASGVPEEECVIDALYPVSEVNQELEEKIKELKLVLSYMQKLSESTTNVNVTTNPIHNKADHGSTISTSNTNNQATVVWAVVASIGLVAAVLITLALNGQLTIEHEGDGKGTIEVESKEDQNAPAK